MSECRRDGELRAQMDGELEPRLAAEVAAHVAACDGCRERQRSMQERAAAVAREMAVGEGAASEPEAAWRRWRAWAAEREGARRGWPRWAWVTAGAAALVIAGSAWPAARSRAANVLAMLRVERVAVAPVELPLSGQPEARHEVAQMIEQMISRQLVVTIKPGPPEAVATPAAAARAAGFGVRLPAAADPERLLVSGEAAFQMTVDRDRVQAIVDEAGRPDLRLPASVNGALIAVHIPRGLVAEYGSCPPPGAPRAERREDGGCLLLREVPSPTISLPPNLNLDQLAEIGLQVAGMSPQEAAAFCQTVDWKSTLVLPVPRDESSYRRLPVDGVQGILVQDTATRPGAAARYALVWVRDGVIYSFSGRGDPATATSLATRME